MSQSDEYILLDGVDDFDFSPEEADFFDLDVKDLREQEGIQYPAVLLSGILFTDCLKVLQSQKQTSYREVDTWVELPDDAGFSHIGSLQLDSDTLLVLRYLRIGVTVYYDAETIEALNLQDPNVLLKFL